MQQLERDAGLAPFGVNPRTVRRGPAAAGDGRPAIEPTFEDIVGEGLDLRPVEPGLLGAADEGRDRAEPETQAAGHGAVAQPQDPLLPEDFTDLSHG